MPNQTFLKVVIRIYVSLLVRLVSDIHFLTLV